MSRPLLLAVSLLLTLSACDLLPGRAATPTPLSAGDEPVLAGRSPAPTPKPTATAVPTPTPKPLAATRGVPAGGAWLLHRGPIAEIGDLARAASRHALIAVEADPELKRITPAQIGALKASGQTRVLGWLSLGVAEASRPLWQRQAAAVEAAALGPRAGRSGETWINPSDRAIAGVLVKTLAKAIADAGVDGFLLGDVELAEHLAGAADGPCSAGCRQGLLDVIQQLREAYPDKLLVAYGATGDVLRLGSSTDRQAIAPMLDGVVGEAVYAPAYHELAEAELAAWKAMKIELNGRPFFLGTADAVPACEAGAVSAAATRARQAGFTPAIGSSLDAARKPCALE